MESEISLTWRKCRWFIVSMAGIIAFFLILFFLLTLHLSEQGSYVKSALLTSDASVQEQTSSVPIRLKIPKINVDVDLESVGLTPQGRVDVPKGHANAAWFNLGPRPGEKGNAVIVGHFGWWRNGIPAIFNNLYTLKNGDKLSVEDEKGATTTFVVRESRSYDPNADASDVFNSSDGNAHLKLITCEGAWDKVSKNYSRRLVIFTDIEKSSSIKLP